MLSLPARHDRQSVEGERIVGGLCTVEHLGAAFGQCTNGHSEERCPRLQPKLAAQCTGRAKVKRPANRTA